MKIIKKITLTLLLTALIFSISPISRAAPSITIPAKSALLAEVESGVILHDSGMNDSRPPDSLTKIMTLLLAAEACESGKADLDEIVVMTESAWADVVSDSSVQSISPGETMPLLDLMYCAYIGSLNEACNMIAEHIAGDTASFVAQMNAKVREFGCKGTNFTNTHGQQNPDQYTTAWDQFLIYREAIKNPIFLEISGSATFTAARTNLSDARKLTNPNFLLNSDSRYYYRYCTSGKPTATFEGGYSLVASAEKDGFSLISVVLGSDAITLEDNSTLMRNLSETKNLFEWGLANFGWRAILSESSLIAKAPVTYGDGVDYVNLRPQRSISLIVGNEIPDSDFTMDITVYSVDEGYKLYAPITAGEVLGEVTLVRNGISYGTIPLVANTNVELHRMQYVKSQLKRLLTSTVARIVLALMTVLISAYIALVIRYNKRRRAHLRRVEEAKKRIIEERRKAYRD